MPYRLTAAATAHGHGTTIDGVGLSRGSIRTRQHDALWTRVLLAMIDLLVGGTQSSVLDDPSTTEGRQTALHVANALEGRWAAIVAGTFNAIANSQ